MNWNYNDTKYIIKRIIIYLLIAFAMFIFSIWNAKADTICIQAQWLGNDYEPNTPVGTISYTYGRWLNACGSYAKVQIPVKVQAITTNPNFAMGLNSTIWRIELTNGETYYGKLENGYIEFYIRTDGVNHNEQLAVKNLYWEGYQPGEYKIFISKYIQAYKLEDNQDLANAINNQSQQQHSDSQAINDSINNDNITPGDADDFKNNQAFSDSTGLESVIQLPLNMVNSLTNTCQPIQITIPFIDYTGEIPCMSTIYKSKFNALYTIVKIVINGFFVYRLLLKIYELVHNAKQPDEDKLEVIDL